MTGQRSRWICPTCRPNAYPNQILTDDVDLPLRPIRERLLAEKSRARTAVGIIGKEAAAKHWPDAQHIEEALGDNGTVDALRPARGRLVE
jgi:hypothetical protein